MIDLRQGDCLELMKDIPDESIDAIICDLPYGTTKCSWDIVIPFDKLWEQYNRIIKNNGAIVLFGQEPFSSFLRMSNINNYKYDIYWEKERLTNINQLKRRVGKTVETICVFYKKQCTYNPQMTHGHTRKVSSAEHKRNCTMTEVYGEHGLTCYDSTDRYPRSIQVFSTDVQKSALHPTQKPVALCEYLIKTYTNEGETVLDNCMGSGTTGVACVNTNRNFIGIELEPKYFDIAKKRIEQAEEGET